MASSTRTLPQPIFRSSVARPPNITPSSPTAPLLPLPTAAGRPPLQSMEASLARIHGGLCRRPRLLEKSRLPCSPTAGFVLYGRRRAVTLSVSMSLEDSQKESSPSEIKTTTTYSTGALSQQVEDTEQLHKPDQDEKSEVDVPLHPAKQQKKGAAKIHDFCLGIPFGGIVLSGGLAGFLLTRNSLSLNGMLYGVALLLLSTSSLKFWRQGKSSFPFILGQAALVATLLWKHLQIYFSTKKLFPTGLFAILSAAMLSFYTYVMASGGNPPPKKLKSAASQSS